MQHSAKRQAVKQWMGLVVLVLLWGTMAACVSSTSLTIPLIKAQALLHQINADTAPLILDVRTVEEYHDGHIPGAVNIPIQELGDRLEQLPTLTVDQPIVVYCERGVRARRAEQLLTQAGFKTILHLEGDMQFWRQQNFPIETPTQTITQIMELPSTAVVTNGFPQQSLDSTVVSLESRWIVSATQAIQLMEQGATVLDAQGPGLGMKRIPGAIPVQWQRFSQANDPDRGKLLTDAAQLTQHLQAVGIFRDRPVVVFANPPHGWGEEGRIVWMLRTLGHPQAVMVDGGIRALMDAGVKQIPVWSGPTTGDFTVPPPPQTPISQGDSTRPWQIDQSALKQILDSSTPHPESRSVVIVDTREFREYAGATPYGERRGGHIPGAVHLYFKDLLDNTGKLKPHDELLTILQSAGITPNSTVMAYCTGGIRSAWLTTVLVNAGFEAQNYAGSMWEWSAAAADYYPLQTLDKDR